MKRYLLLILMMIFSLLFFCSDKDSQSSLVDDTNNSSVMEKKGKKIEITTNDYVVIEELKNKKDKKPMEKAKLIELELKYFSMAMALLVTEEDVCSLLKNNIAKQFDGDYDVLWGTLKDVKLNRGQFKKMLEACFDESAKKLLKAEDFDAIKLLNLAIPVQFENWDGISPLLVTYCPITINDIDVQTLEAFDAELNVTILDAQKEPDFPVLVIGMNERVDENMICPPKIGS